MANLGPPRRPHSYKDAQHNVGPRDVQYGVHVRLICGWTTSERESERKSVQVRQRKSIVSANVISARKLTIIILLLLLVVLYLLFINSETRYLAFSWPRKPSYSRHRATSMNDGRCRKSFTILDSSQIIQ